MRDWWATCAMLQALKKGQLAGAVDVFEAEPLPPSDHTACYSEGSPPKPQRATAQEVGGVCIGRYPLSFGNPEARKLVGVEMVILMGDVASWAIIKTVICNCGVGSLHEVQLKMKKPDAFSCRADSTWTIWRPMDRNNRTPWSYRLGWSSDWAGGSNAKASFIMGHSLQAVALLVQAAGVCFAVPVAARIHEGIVWSARDRRTLLDKLSALLLGLDWSGPLTLVADAYYAAAKFARSLLGQGHHLVTRVRSNAVAYFPPSPRRSRKPRRGRRRTYGHKTHLQDWFRYRKQFLKAASPVYGELRRLRSTKGSAGGVPCAVPLSAGH